MTPWEIKAKEFANCNCSYGLPVPVQCSTHPRFLRGRRRTGD